ncbi:MAG: hypothetical protein ACKOAD_05965 [Gammaproteobacteria bacterium]
MLLFLVIKESLKKTKTCLNCRDQGGQYAPDFDAPLKKGVSILRILKPKLILKGVSLRRIVSCQAVDNIPPIASGGGGQHAPE